MHIELMFSSIGLYSFIRFSVAKTIFSSDWCPVRHRIIVFVHATWTNLSVIIVLQSPYSPVKWYRDSHVYVIDCSTGDQYDTVKAIAIFTEVTICSDKSYRKMIHWSHGKVFIEQHYKLNDRWLCGITGDLPLSGSYKKACLVKTIVQLKVFLSEELYDFQSQSTKILKISRVIKPLLTQECEGIIMKFLIVLYSRW